MLSMDFPGHFSHVFQQLNHQRHNAQLCDCVVVVGSQTFQAHSSILAACSSHFRALLSSTEDEGGESGIDQCLGGGHSVIKLDPEVVTPDAFATLLDMIYTSTLSLGSSNVMDVLLAASHLHLNIVVKACKLDLSKRNFPSSPPKGWRSMQQSPSCQGSIQESSDSVQHLEHSLVTSAMEEGLLEGGAGLEVSQSGGAEGDREGISCVSSEHRTALTVGHKRKLVLQDERLKRTCGYTRENYSEPTPTVARGTSNREEGGGEEEPSAAECLKTAEGFRSESRGEEVEEKYEAPKGELEELQLPSQSDSCAGGTHDEEEGGGGTVVKVKVGDEEREEQEMIIEVKKENLSSSFPGVDIVANNPLSPEDNEAADENGSDLDEPATNEQITPASSNDVTCSMLQHQSSTNPQMYSLTDNRHVGKESVNGEGLDSLSDLALSCFLTPSSESVMGTLEMDNVLPNLTVTAVATATAEALAKAGEAGEPPQTSDTTSSSSYSDCSPSIVFPVNSVPFQPLLSTQGHSFSNTLILQPTQSCLGGFLQGIRPAPSLEASVMSPSGSGQSRGGGSSGSSVFRRIAPKAIPGSEGSTDPDPSSSSGSAGDSANRPPLTRASEDVLSKCKKAAAEDHVLLVEGEKKYACSICCKTFMNLTDCKKHIRVHTGEKPYPCPKCGKRFSQSSHLYKHSKNTCLHWKGGQHPFSDTLL